MILFRYFCKEVFASMTVITIVVMVIAVGSRFSGYLSDAASGRISREIVWLLLMYRLPGIIELILPISFFLAIMLAYGRLYADNEMVWVWRQTYTWLHADSRPFGDAVDRVSFTLVEAPR